MPKKRLSIMVDFPSEDEFNIFLEDSNFKNIEEVKTSITEDIYDNSNLKVDGVNVTLTNIEEQS